MLKQNIMSDILILTVASFLARNNATVDYSDTKCHCHEIISYPNYFYYIQNALILFHDNFMNYRFKIAWGNHRPCLLQPHPNHAQCCVCVFAHKHHIESHDGY